MIDHAVRKIIHAWVIPTGPVAEVGSRGQNFPTRLGTILPSIWQLLNKKTQILSPLNQLHSSLHLP